MDEATIDIAQLYRRAGFGARPEEIKAAAAVGYVATVDSWVSTLGTPDRGADQIPTPDVFNLTEAFLKEPESRAKDAKLADVAGQLSTLIQWWVARMVAADNPLTEKLTLLLHDLFPTAIAKVFWPGMMLRQNQVLRSKGPGRFDDLVNAVVFDPAMLLWLDGIVRDRNTPNENLSRELMERFTMGVGTYTQADVVAASHCFTGMTYDPQTLGAILVASSHDSTPRTFLGHHGVSTPRQVIELVTMSAASHRYIPSKFWSWLAWTVPTTDPVVSTLSGAYAENLNLTQLLRAVLLHPRFRSPEARSGLVKQPIEFVAGALRALRVDPRRIAAGEPALNGVLADLGQVPFDPPSVGGWGQNQVWLTSASALARWRFATQLAASSLSDLSMVADVRPKARPDAAANLLSVDGWSPASRKALESVAGDPAAVVAQALVSPEYVSN